MLLIARLRRFVTLTLLLCFAFADVSTGCAALRTLATLSKCDPGCSCERVSVSPCCAHKESYRAPKDVVSSPGFQLLRGLLAHALARIVPQDDLRAASAARCAAERLHPATPPDPPPRIPSSL